MGYRRGQLYRGIAVLMACLLVVGASASFVVGATKTKKKEKKPVLSITAASASVYCENTGETVVRKNANKKMAPQDLNKLMTALLVVQSVPLDKEVKVSKEAAKQKGTAMGLKEGERLSVKELLYGSLLASGNDATYALGETVAKSQSAAVKRMNKIAKDIGCTQTKFVDTTGVSAKNVTTAADFNQIWKVARSNDTIEKITGTEKVVIPENNKSKRRTITKKSTLLGKVDEGIVSEAGAIGSNTGNTLAVGYRHDGMELCIVLFGVSKAKQEEDLKNLTTYLQSVIKGQKVVEKGEYAGKVRIRHGAKTRLKTYTSRAGYAYLPKEGSKDLISKEVVMKSDVTAPVKNGDVVGYYYIKVGDDVTNRVPLVIREGVNVGWFPSYLGISNVTAVVIFVLLVALTIFGLWVSSLRRRARRRKERIRRRMIREMAHQRYMDEEDHRRRDWTF